LLKYRQFQSFEHFKTALKTNMVHRVKVQGRRSLRYSRINFTKSPASVSSNTHH
jgi:hypothetical protein